MKKIFKPRNFILAGLGFSVIYAVGCLGDGASSAEKFEAYRSPIEVGVAASLEDPTLSDSTRAILEAVHAATVNSEGLFDEQGQPDIGVVATTGSAIANLVAPGSGTIVGSGILALGSLLALFDQRNKKKKEAKKAAQAAKALNQTKQGITKAMVKSDPEDETVALLKTILEEVQDDETKDIIKGRINLGD